VSGSFGGSGRFDPAVEPGGYGGVPQIARAPSQRWGFVLGAEGSVGLPATRAIGHNEDRPLTMLVLARGRSGWCGGSRIRTLVGVRRRIYSPLHVRPGLDDDGAGLGTSSAVVVGSNDHSSNRNDRHRAIPAPRPAQSACPCRTSDEETTRTF
jgi:hypothetical protein